MKKRNQILIVGAGPAGVSTSIFLSRKGIAHTIIDKASFPRDKICGDALSGKVVHILNKIDPEITRELTEDKNHYTGCYGICFFAPNGRQLDVPFSMKPERIKNAPGFVSRRIDFDHYLYRLLDTSYAEILPETELLDIGRENGSLTTTWKNKTGEEKRSFDLVIGAEGDRSVVARKLDPLKKNLSTYCAAVRAYYTGVEDVHPQKFIELHFLKDLLPGYFWIFPMNDGSANVGIGMLSEVVSKKGVNLRKKMAQIIACHPIISKRFKHARLEGSYEGWGLPLGSARRPLAGDNYLLTGDAGSLIDPFTGEGIGNAMHSGMLAAEQVEEAIAAGDFSKSFLKKYETKLYASLGKELGLSHGIQKLAKHAWLFNMVVGKASRNEMLRETITCMFDDLDIRERLRKPGFYFRLIFN